MWFSIVACFIVNIIIIWDCSATSREVRPCIVCPKQIYIIRNDNKSIFCPRQISVGRLLFAIKYYQFWQSRGLSLGQGSYRKFNFDVKLLKLYVRKFNFKAYAAWIRFSKISLSICIDGNENGNFGRKSLYWH